MKTDQSYGVVLFRIERGVPLVLLVREHVDAGLNEERGSWGLPKGHANPNELPLTAATRELTEEAGITTCQLRENFSWSVRYIVTRRNGEQLDKTVTFYFGTTEQIHLAPRPSEIAACAWFSVADAIERATFRDIKEVIKKAGAVLTSQL